MFQTSASSKRHLKQSERDVKDCNASSKQSTHIKMFAEIALVEIRSFVGRATSGR